MNATGSMCFIYGLKLNHFFNGQCFLDGRKKIEEMYHPTSDRSEFYSMSDLLKPPVLFTPSDDIEKVVSDYNYLRNALYEN